MNNELAAWVTSIASHTKPDRVRFCDGSPAEARHLEDSMVADGTLVRLNEVIHPRSFLYLNAEFLAQFGRRLPDAIRREHQAFTEPLRAQRN